MAAVAAPEGLKLAKKKPAFPFTRLAGQEDMKLALLLNVVDPTIGGVLIMGDRGTGKSVAVRSLVDLLPMIDIVQDSPFNSHPTSERAPHGARGRRGGKRHGMLPVHAPPHRCWLPRRRGWQLRPVATAGMQRRLPPCR